ncbi:MAG: CDP-glycerol glycerophosphotransferase family protein [Alphaproteobacteria bacterium]|nr:CDP-glycerol glycerophosphotransferase family protein [Alphaproteobacteria bacterium]
MKLFFLFGLFLLCPKISYAYIDPATGNAFFTLAITIISAILFGLQYIASHLFMLKGISFKKNNRIKLLLFSEGNQYWTWFEPILDELERRQIDTTYYTASSDDLCFQKNYHHVHPFFIGKGNKAYAKMAFVRADIVLMTTPGLDVYQLKRSKHVKKYVHFYHAFADCCSYRLFGTDYYDALLLDNAINGTYVRELEQKRNLPPKELVIVGNILLDKMKKEKREKEVKIKGNKTILIAPSWGKESMLYKYGEKILSSLSDMPYNIIIRPHPQMKIDNPRLLEQLQKEYMHISKITWDFEREGLKSMSNSDIMISDFSGIVFEYAFIYKKPVITLSKEMNIEMYDVSDLDKPTWKYQVWKQLGHALNAQEIQELPKIIEHLLQSNISEHIEKVAQCYWEQQGNCIRNIVNYLENNLKKDSIKS